MAGPFEPAAILGSGSLEAKQALILLNHELPDWQLFQTIWNRCQVHVCADGGANRLYDYFSSPTERQKYVRRHLFLLPQQSSSLTPWIVAIVTNKQLPDVVTGDFDSLRDDVREFYRASGVKVIHDADQYATDFMKSVKAVDGEFGNGYRFIAMPSVGSRVDHNFHAIHMLFALREKNQLLFLVSNESITFLLDEGDNEIITPQSLLGKTCGIIPIVGPTIITTHGLEWDVTDWPTSFGTQVSTSNHLVEDTVHVKCSKPSLFTVEIRRKPNGTLPQALH